MLVAHSTHPSSLTQRYLRAWVSSFGLDVTRLKVLAVSFSVGEVKHAVPSIPVVPALGSTLTTIILGGTGTGTQTQTQTQMQGQHNLQQQQQQQHQHQQQLQFNGGAQGGLIYPGGVAGHQLAGVGAGLATTMANPPLAAPVTLLGMGESRKEEVVEDDYEIVAAKMQGWMEPRRKSEVETWLSLKNTDLRASEKWLVYVSPTMKKKLGMRER
jgi:hypothetical protein